MMFLVGLGRWAIGRKYVDLLAHEVAQVAAGNYSSDRLLVFSSVMLQRDRSVKKVADIRRVLERRMKLWVENEFDLLLQEAERCDKLIRKIQRNVEDEEQVVKYLRG